MTEIHTDNIRRFDHFPLAGCGRALAALGLSLIATGALRADSTSAGAPDGKVFHVSNAGNDAWDGSAPEHRGGTTGPWKSLAKVNERQRALQGGRVLFRRGDRFEGRLEVGGRNITFAAYGEGGRPVITGARALPGDWKPVPGRPNVHACRLPQDIKDVTILMREGASLPLARTPNVTDPENPAFLTFTSRTVDSVTDPELDAKEDMGGAELVLRKNNWTYHAYTVSKVEGDIVRFPNQEPYTPKKGDENIKSARYFLQKHPATLDMDGEWFFDPSGHTLYLYSESAPKREAYTYTAEAVVVDISGAKGITLEGLCIQMAGSLGIQMRNSGNIRVRDCEVMFCGQEGIRLESTSATIEDSIVRDCFGTGIHAVEKGRVVVTRNTISRIGLIAGRGWNAGRHAARRNGIMIMGGNSEASYNRISDIGYIGIQHVGGRNLVRRNVIERYNITAFDGGAIYTYGNQRGSIVEENIILHGMANTSGLAGVKFFATGIQCDAKTQNLVIRNNTIAYPRASTNTGAIHLNFESRQNEISGNTILTRHSGISTFDRDPFDRKPDEPSPPSMAGNRFENNIIVRLSGAQPDGPFRWATLCLHDAQQCDLELQGEFRDNVIAVPFATDQVINELQVNCRDRKAEKFDTWFASAADWDRMRPYATGNLDAPVRFEGLEASDEDIRLFYNDSDQPKTFTIPAGPRHVDAHGKPQSGAVTVAPWRSVVLFRVPEPK